jgi:hypothetical protein
VGPAVVIQILLVRVISTAVFEDPTDQGYDSQAGGNERDPETDGQAKEATGARQAENQRPPAPGTEVSLLAGAFVDLSVRDGLPDACRCACQ